MLVCGEATISFAETFGDEIKSEDTWKDEAFSIIQSMEFHRSTEQAKIQFFYLNQGEFFRKLKSLIF